MIQQWKVPIWGQSGRLGNQKLYKSNQCKSQSLRSAVSVCKARTCSTAPRSPRHSTGCPPARCPLLRLKLCPPLVFAGKGLGLGQGWDGDGSGDGWNGCSVGRGLLGQSR